MIEIAKTKVGRGPLTQVEFELAPHEADAIRAEATREGKTVDQFLRAASRAFVNDYRGPQPLAA